MAKKTGLGQGLDALFGPAPEEEQVQENDTLKKLKITEVEPNRDQPRKNFDQEALEELAQSIGEYGLIQPIVVTKKDGYYSIIAGERRWRASKLAGLKEIPAIIRDDDEKVNSEISLIENMQREDLNPYEKALRRFSVGNRYVGTVSMVDTTGVFVALDGGVDCLCSYPKRGRPPRGARVTVRILGLNMESNRIWGAITHIAAPR